MIQKLSVLEAKVLYLTGSSKVANLKNVNFGKLLGAEVTEDCDTINNGNDMENIKVEYLSNCEIETEDLFETNCTTEMICDEKMEMNHSKECENKTNTGKRAKKSRIKKRESMQTRTLELKTIHFDKDRKNIKVYQNKKKLLQSRLSTPTTTEENKNTTQLNESSVPKKSGTVINGNFKLRMCSQTIDKNPQENIIIRQTDKSKTEYQIEPAPQNVKENDLKIINISHNVPIIKCETAPDYNVTNCDFSTKNNLVFDADIKMEEMSE